MTSERKPFSIDVGKLKTRAKESSPGAIDKLDRAAEEHGFVVREPARRRGRVPSPRTGQVHAKVLPSIADEIAAESQRRGVTQGVIVEEAWNFYKKEKEL